MLSSIENCQFLFPIKNVKNTLTLATPRGIRVTLNPKGGPKKP